MGIEIERRFLVKNQDWKPKVILSEDFSQAYLASNPDEWTTRVRIIDNNQAFLTMGGDLRLLKFMHLEVARYSDLQSDWWIGAASLDF